MSAQRTNSGESHVDPQCNVDVILHCLSESPESHAATVEEELLQVDGFSEREAFLLTHPVEDRADWMILVQWPWLYRVSPMFREAISL